MRILTSAITLLSLLAANGSIAQLSFGGHPYGVDRSYGLPEPSVITMPAVDVAALMAEDAARMADGKKGPYRFGSNHAVDIGLDNAGLWRTMSNGDRVWRTTIHCPGALTINMEFHQFEIPDGARVFVYNDMGDVLGGFEAGSNPGHTELGVDLIAGERVTVEYVEPARVAGQGRLRIGQVTHGYRDIFGIARSLNESGSCNNNVNCPEGDPWRDQIRSVAIIMTGGEGFCTGTLINNCANDGTPYFLTANHCLVGNVGTWLFRFNWNSPNCTPTTNGPTGQSVSGATLKASNATSDVALLQLNATPPASYNVFYAGWDRSGAAPAGAVAIHHPSGDVKKISFENDPLTSANYLGAAGSGTSHWRVARWDDGTTEGGSSGSALFSPEKLIIGQLHGGWASCNDLLADYYGRFSVSFPTLQPWLGNCGNTLQGYPVSTVGIDELPVSGMLDIWPNPGSGSFKMGLPSAEGDGHVISVFDAVGRAVHEEKVAPGAARQIQLGLESLPTGLYMVEARSAKARLQQRLVIAR